MKSVHKLKRIRKIFCTVQYKILPLLPMAGRPKNFDESEAIRKATYVFWRKGYEASSTEELLHEMGIGKGSFYLHFKEGKKELYNRSLALFSSDAMLRFNEHSAKAADGITFLKNFLLSSIDKPEIQVQNGCYLGNAIVEMSNIDQKTKDHAGALMEKLEMAFEKIIREAQASGRIAKKKDAKLIAKYLINLRNGIHVTQRTEANKKALRQVVEVGLEILN